MAIKFIILRYTSFKKIDVPRETLEKGDGFMEQMKFKPGDKVRIKGGGIFGKIGKIAFVRDAHYASYPYIVIFDENIGAFMGDEEQAKEATEKGFDYRKCFMYGGSELELVEEKKMTGNKVIDLLMQGLGIEVDEEFMIKGDYEEYSPHHFNVKGELRDKNGNPSKGELMGLIYGKSEIKKIPKPEIKEMTVAELEEALDIPKGTLRVKGDE